MSGDAPVCEDRSGQVIAQRYRLQARLGVGGMGEVYIAKHTEIPRRFALKLMHPEFARDPQLLARFKLEAEAAASLVSENVVEVADFGYAADGAPFIVMELLDGVDLRRLTQRRGLSISQAVQIVMQVCSGVAAAHQQSIVHRDLKLENLFLARRGERVMVKVLDFGIAKLRNQTLGTGRGRVLGTPQYMAPEQVRAGSEADARSDIYALGVILYELLTGQAAHPGNEVHEVLSHVLFERPKAIRTLNLAVPAELAAVVHKACAASVDDRYQTALQLRAALLPFAGHDALPSPDSRADTAAPQVTLPAQVTPLSPVSLARALQPHSTGENAAPDTGFTPRRAALAAVVVTCMASVWGFTQRERAPGGPRALPLPAAVIETPANAVKTLSAPAGPEPSQPEPTPTPRVMPEANATRPGAVVPELRNTPAPRKRPNAPTAGAPVPEPKRTDPTILEVHSGDDTILFKRENPLRR